MTPYRRALCNWFLIATMPVWGGFYSLFVFMGATFGSDEHDRDRAVDVWSGEKWITKA